MPLSYDDDYRPTTSLQNGPEGKTLTRTVFMRAADEVALWNDPDFLPRGTIVDFSDASGFIDYVYLQNQDVNQIPEASADEDDNFLFQVDYTFAPLKRNPQVNKASWRVSFRAQQITLNNVAEDADQTHYGDSGSGSEQWPQVTTGINEDEEGPAGVAIDEMVEVLTIDYWRDPDDVKDYLTSVRNVINTTNDADFSGPWGTYSAGEAKITGLEVNSASDEVTTVSIEISRSVNNSALTVDLDVGGAVVVDKKGWEYLWVRWIKSVDPDDATEEPVLRRIDAHVAKVYDEGNFAALGISDSLFI